MFACVLWDCVSCTRFFAHICEQMCICSGTHCPHVCVCVCVCVCLKENLCPVLNGRGLKGRSVQAPELGLGVQAQREQSVCTHLSLMCTHQN